MLKNSKVYGFYKFEKSKEYKFYKRLCNGKEKRITYIEWKKHIVEKCKDMDKEKLENFKHFLINEMRDKENKLETVSVIWIPINILYLTICSTVIFAILNLGIDTLEKSTNILGRAFGNMNIEALNKNVSIDILQKEFDFIIRLMLSVTSIIFGLIIFCYFSGKYLRKQVFVQQNFYKDIITIIEELQNK